jgi:hypothetical protein
MLQHGFGKFCGYDLIGNTPIRISIKATYAVISTANESAKTGDITTNVVYTVTVTNNGSDADTFDISKSGDIWTTVLSANSIGPIAGSGGTDTFTVTVTIPNDANDEDTDTCVVTVTSQEEPSALDSVTLISTASFPFGIVGDGGDYLIAADSPSLQLGENDFTIEFWFKSTGVSGNWEVFIRKNSSYYIQVYRPGLWFLFIKVVGGGEVKWWGILPDATVFDGEWHHFAGVHDISAGTGVLYLDGVALTNNIQNDVNMIAPDAGTTLTILGSLGGEGVLGVMDEVRISNVTRYTANFTPPTARFVADVNTLALYHFQENTGTTTVDDSENENTLDFGPGGAAPSWATGKFGIGT